jgi:hypothetical protein
MANYTQPKILKYSNVDIKDDRRSVTDYSSINKDLIMSYIKSYDSKYFGFKILQEGQTLEKISYDLYNTPDYWDLLLLVNEYNPLFDTTFTFDTLTEISEDKVAELDNRLFNDSLPVAIKSALKKNYYKKYSQKNEINRVLKYIKHEHINEFLREGFAKGYLT